MLSKTVHLRPLNPSNVLRVKTPERAARLHERNAIDESKHDYKPIMRTSYDSNVYKFQKSKLSQAPRSSEIGSNNGKSDDFQPCHPINYQLYKKKKYNEQLQSVHHVPPSEMISQEEFRAVRSQSNGFAFTKAAERGEEADQRNVYRKNLYISKPFEDINKDFKFQPLVRNAQTTSEDTPYWCQGTSKYYTQDNFNMSNKMKLSMSNLPKSDIFGKNQVNYPKQDHLFVAQPPSKGQRYELNKMVIVEKNNDPNYNNRVPHIRLQWDENPQKQSYDTSKLTSKIGGSAQPYVKKLVEKQTFDPAVAYKKIGEQSEIGRLKKEKVTDWKIGHPDEHYSYTKKGRDDGFYGNRKVITGPGYQTSTFFV